jgi:hypothetical protein
MTMEEGMSPDNLAVPAGVAPTDEIVDPVFAHIRKRREHYVLADAKLSEGRLSWNWAAFFVPTGWMLYRKMIGWATVYYVLLFLVSFLIPGIPTFEQFRQTPLSSSFNVLLWILEVFLNRLPIALFGDALYLRSVRRKVAKRQAAPHADAPTVLAHMLADPDTSWGSFWGFGLLYSVVQSQVVRLLGLMG